MCLISNKPPQIADKDIVVFKELKKDLKSVYQGFQYEFGVQYNTLIEGKVYNKYTYYDLDFYCPIDQEYFTSHFNVLQQDDGDENFTGWAQGFHSVSEKVYQEWLDSTPNANNIIVKCIIPKGTRYVEDFVGFMVSDSIVVLESVKRDLTDLMFK